MVHIYTMKSITIHNLDSDLADKIELLAKEKGISQNKLIKNVLRHSLGMTEKSKNANLHEFRFSLSSEEVDAFFDSTEDLSQIEESEW